MTDEPEEMTLLEETRKRLNEAVAGMRDAEIALEILDEVGELTTKERSEFDKAKERVTKLTEALKKFE